MTRTLAILVAFLCGCYSDYSVAVMRYPKEVRKYNKCVEEYNEAREAEISACRDKRKAWNTCEREHYEKYPHQRRVTCPGGVTIFDQIDELFNGIPDDCGYSQVPKFHPGEPRLEDENACGTEPSHYYECDETPCQRPESPYYNRAPE